MKDLNMRSRSPLIPVVALMVSVLAGCGGGGGGSTSSPTGPVASLSPGSLTFPMQLLATPSASKTVTLQNTGNAVLMLTSAPIFVAGTNAADFSFTTDCGANLASGASCAINVTFTPAASGSRSATLSIASNAAASPANVAITGTGTGDNALAVTVDMGPLPTTFPTANILYADVTFCTPGSTVACKVVHHIQVDTGSYGLRVFKSALAAATGPVVAPQVALAEGTSDPLFECVQYADGYTWGSVAVVDVQIGSRRLSNLRIQLTGDTNATGGVPSDCSKALTPENQVSSFGANGILGIGNFLQDCGSWCADPLKLQSGNYYQCPATSACVGVPVALGLQVQNPISLMASDNNGALLSLPAVAGSGAATTSGFLYFGVGTQSDNMVGTAKWFGLDPGFATLTTSYGSKVLTSSIIDSGSNAYFFDSTTLHVCTNANYSGFYCPLTGGSIGSATSASQSAVITAVTTPATTTINFTIDNTDTLFTTYGNDAVYPNLGGTISGVSPTALSNAFDWGLPFFYGRPVFVLFEGSPGPAGSSFTGPALAF
jgi:hypothetical protein